jgi:hypothetical protein
VIDSVVVPTRKSARSKTTPRERAIKAFEASLGHVEKTLGQQGGVVVGVYIQGRH